MSDPAWREEDRRESEIMFGAPAELSFGITRINF